MAILYNWTTDVRMETVFFYLNERPNRAEYTSS